MPNIKIRTMHGNASTRGLFLEDGQDILCPKLKPGEVVTVPEDHPVFNGPSEVHISITKDVANRPYRFGSLQEALGQKMSEEDALNTAGAIGTSLEMSAKIREDNRSALEKAKDEGVTIPVDDFAVVNEKQPAGVCKNNAHTPPKGTRRGKGT